MPNVIVGNQELHLQLDPAMPPGHEGTVYADPSDPAFVIKLWHAPDDDLRHKLRIMIANPLRSPDVAWPVAEVFALDRTTIIGCRLPYAARKSPLIAVYSTNPTTRWIGADYAFRLEVAISLMTAFDRIHQHGCVIGDVSLTNTLVGKDASVCQIDTDSFQITRDGQVCQCKVGTPSYIPPELYGIDLTKCIRTTHHDAFGAAALVFGLLVGPGTHPFAAHHVGTGTAITLDGRIQQGIWAYSRNGHSNYVPRTDSPFALLHPFLQPLAYRAFEDGHSHPSARPLPGEWLVALNAVRQDVNFVRVIAPQLESSARRQPAPGGARTATCYQSITGFLRRSRIALLWRPRRQPAFYAAAILGLIATLLGGRAMLSKRTQINFVPQADCSQPAPALYEGLSSHWGGAHLRREGRTASLPSPNLYEQMAHQP